MDSQDKIGPKTPPNEFAQKGRGRPKKKLTKEMIERGYQLAKQGRTDRQVATALGVCERTLNRWKADQDFMSALREGKNEADEEVLWGLYARAVGFSYWEVTEERVPNQDTSKRPQSGDLSRQGASHLVVTKRVQKVLPPDPTAALWWLRNRRPQEWRDRRNDIGPSGGHIVIRELAGLGIAELEALAAELQRKADTLSD